MEPRAGFDPATNSLRGCRSTGLSHRGTYCELSEKHIFKTFGNKQQQQSLTCVQNLRNKKCVLECSFYKHFTKNQKVGSPVSGTYFFIFRKYSRATATPATTAMAATINVIGNSSSVPEGVSASWVAVK